MSPIEDAANLLIKILDALLTLGEFQKSSDLLKRVYITLKTYELKDWQIEIIHKLIVEEGEEQRIERIGRVLEKEEGIRLEDLNGYLVLLQREFDQTSDQIVRGAQEFKDEEGTL